MASFLAENLSIIERRWPGIAQALATAARAPRAELVQDGPQATLLIDGIHLTSSYDRLAEARLQASLIPLESAEAWVYGFGLGDLPRVLLPRKQLKRIHVVIMNLGVVRHACRNFDHGDWLQDPRINLVTAQDQPTLRFPFAALPSSLQLAEDGASRLRDLIVLALSTPFIGSKHRVDDPQLRQRLEENESFVLRDGDVASLFGAYAGKSVVVAGAGPTLSLHYESLRLKRGDYCLIAVDAALRPLFKAGIQPDAVVVVDAHETKILPFFQDVELAAFSGTPLVYFPVVHPRVLEHWPGPRLVGYSEHGLYQDFAMRHPRGRLFSSGSVIHPAVDLAVKMGAAKIILLGADFSFPGAVSHVAECVVRRDMPTGSQEHWVLNGHGRRVSTSLAMRGFLRDLEAFMERHPEVQFVNGSRDGALIQGADYCGW